MNDEEYKEWKKNCTGIKHDITTTDQAIEFMKKLKAEHGHTTTNRWIRLYLVPKINGNESALIMHGHHAVCDAVAAFQATYIMSDDAKDGEYPFFRFPEPPFAYRMFLYLTFPY